ncbi:MAG: fibronectin type III domain-containing protein [Iamia sp.]
MSVAAVMALLLGVAPILLGAGRAPSALDSLGSSAWFSRANGDLIQVNGLNGEQLFELNIDGAPQGTVLEDGTVVYVLSDDGLRVIDTSSRRRPTIEGAVPADQLLVNDQSVWLVNSEAADLAWARPLPSGSGTIRFRPGDDGEPVLGRAGLDPAGVLWVPDGRGSLRRVVRAVTANAVPVPGSGPLDAVVVGSVPVALRTGVGQARVVRRGRAGDLIDLGAEVNRPLEDQPEGPLYVSRTDGRVVRVDLDSDRVTTSALPGRGPTTAPVVGREGVVVVRGTILYVLDPDTLEVINERDLGEVDPSRISLRTRDGIAYILDEETDLGAVVNGTDIFGVDLRPDGSVPSAGVADPGSPAPPLNPAPEGFGPDLRPVPGLGETGGGDDTDGGGGNDTGGGGGDDTGGGGGNDTGGGGGNEPREPPPEEGPTCGYDVNAVRAAAAPAGASATVTVDWTQGAVDARCATQGATVFASIIPEAGGDPVKTGPVRRYTDLAGAGRDSLAGVPPGRWRARVTVVVGGRTVKSAQSAPFTIASPTPELPGQPGPLQIEELDGVLDVSWSPPPGGADDYRIVVVGRGDQPSTSATSTTITGLTNGTRYDVLVYARRGGLEGTTPASGSGTPRAPAVKVDDFRVTNPGGGNDALLDLSVSLSDGSAPASCTIEYTRVRGGDGAQVEVSPCQQLTVGFYASFYDVTLVRVDGQALDGLPLTKQAESNRASLYSPDANVLNHNMGSTNLDKGGNYSVDCRFDDMTFRSWGRTDRVSERIPFGAAFQSSSIIQRPPTWRKIVPCSSF